LSKFGFSTRSDCFLGAFSHFEACTRSIIEGLNDSSGPKSFNCQYDLFSEQLHQPLMHTNPLGHEKSKMS
jgi:hypothetical protein